MSSTPFRRRRSVWGVTDRLPPQAVFLALLALLFQACTSRGESSTTAAVSTSSRAPRESTAATVEGETGLAIEVLSFNVRWDGFLDGANSWVHRRRLVARVLRDSLADSIGLQEPSERQVRDLVDIDPAYEAFTYEESSQPILFRRQRFRLADAGGFLLFEGDWRPGSRRTCTWVRLEERSTGLAYYHFNVHFDHRSARSKSVSAQRLVLGIESREHPDPIVVTGDFNADEQSAAMRYLLRGGELEDGNGAPVRSPLSFVDTFRSVHPNAAEAGTFGGFVGKRNGVKIDFVLVQPGTVVRAARIVRTESGGQYPSDHYPVAASLRFAPSPPPSPATTLRPAASALTMGAAN